MVEFNWATFLPQRSHELVQKQETQTIDPVSDQDYFSSDTVHMRSEYLQGALEIGEESDGEIELLIPRVVTDDGEWEHWTFSTSAPGAFRSPSFLAAFAGVDGDAHGARHILGHDAWPNRPVEAYIDALHAGDSQVRRQAAAALEVLGDPRAVGPLIRTLSADTDAAVRWNAARALGKLGHTEAVGPLVAGLDNPDRTVRVNAVHALARLHDRRAIAPLVRALQDDTPEVRYYAAGALGTIGDATVVAPLLAAQATGTQNAPMHAINALGPQAVLPLIDALTDDDSRIRAAAELLGDVMLRDARAIEPLRAALQDPVAAVRERAATSLRALTEPVNENAIHVYTRILAVGPSYMRAFAVKALASTPDPRVIEALRVASRDEDATVREYATDALRSLGDSTP